MICLDLYSPTIIIMKTYFAYIRVSTTRQGEEGVSLQEQKRAILEYASKRGITVDSWFEEQVSAAKRGRPVFTKLVNLLKSKKSSGLIIHKIDRGARNLRDWADMAELMDSGVEVHFAHESIDLHTRSGRLSADILAVVAADYIRNLREETLKGINGRLKQGLFPFSAPVGYVNNGGGKVKTIDPVRGPLIRQAFELYATREYPLSKIETELFDRGLRTRTGKRVYVSQFATILRNPFYMGLIRLRKRKEVFPGLHAPLVGSTLFNEVQKILDGKRTKLRHRNHFLFRLMIFCEHCKLNVNGELQKGHVYYRCHRRACPITCIRQEKFEAAILDILKQINIAPEEEPLLAEVFKEFRQKASELARTVRLELEEELKEIQQSLATLLQRFLDSSISKELFDEGHEPLLLRRSMCEEKLQKLGADGMIEQTENFLSKLRSLCERFCTGTQQEMRSVADEIFERISTSGSTIHLTLTPIFEHLARREKTREGWEELLLRITREVAVK